MPTYTSPVTAAVAVVGADLFEGKVWARSPADRVLQGVSYTGSAVVGDTEIEVFVDETRIGSYFNSKLLTPNIDDMFAVGNLGVPAGALLRAMVLDAAATSIVYAQVQIANIGARRR